LGFWKFHVDWGNSGNSTLTRSTIPVQAYNAACGGGTCVPQPNTKQKLDSLADRLMFRLAYRNFGNGDERMVVNHARNRAPGSEPKRAYCRHPRLSTFQTSDVMRFLSSLLLPALAAAASCAAIGGGGTSVTGGLVFERRLVLEVHESGRLRVENVGSGAIDVAWQEDGETREATLLPGGSLRTAFSAPMRMSASRAVSSPAANA